MNGIKTIEGNHSARELRFAIVAARFNDVIVEKLIRGALETLQSHGATEDQIDLIRVPGAFELPLAIGKLLANRRHDAIIALGAVIRGETPHFDYVASECARGIARLALDSSVPIAFGVLTTDTVAQALERAGGASAQSGAKDSAGKSGKEGGKHENKGAAAAVCAIEMANLFRRLDG
jgi:6,7-dimethyl-8-ribityllumazine synthase